MEVLRKVERVTLLDEGGRVAIELIAALKLGKRLNRDAVGEKQVAQGDTLRAEVAATLEVDDGLRREKSLGETKLTKQVEHVCLK